MNKDCKNCTHNEVCRYKDEYKKLCSNYIDNNKDNICFVNINCKYFSDSNHITLSPNDLRFTEFNKPTKTGDVDYMGNISLGNYKKPSKEEKANYSRLAKSIEIE